MTKVTKVTKVTYAPAMPLTLRTALTPGEHRQLAAALDGMHREAWDIALWLGRERLPRMHEAVRALNRARDAIADAQASLAGEVIENYALNCVNGANE